MVVGLMQVGPLCEPPSPHLTRRLGPSRYLHLSKSYEPSDSDPFFAVRIARRGIRSHRERKCGLTGFRTSLGLLGESRIEVAPARLHAPQPRRVGALSIWRARLAS